MSRLKINPWTALKFVHVTPEYRRSLDVALEGLKEYEIGKQAQEMVQLSRDYEKEFSVWPNAATQELLDYYELHKAKFSVLDTGLITQFYDHKLESYDQDAIKNTINNWLLYYHQKNVWATSAKHFQEEDTSIATDGFMKSILQVSDIPFSHNDRLEGNLFDPKAYVGNDMVLIRSGYKGIDEMLSPTGNHMDGGFVRGGLYVIGAGAKAGKTLVLGNIAVQQIKMKRNVAIASFEMPFFDYATRMNTNLHDIHYKKYTPERMKELLNENDYDYGALHIRQFPVSCTPQDITEWVLGLERKHNIKIDVVIVDYVQIVTSGRRNATSDSYTKVKNVCEDLRSAAMQYDWVCLTAAQAKRDVEAGLHLTQLDIAESHGIIQTADALWSFIKKGSSKTRYLEVIASRRSSYEEEIKFSIDWGKYKLKEVSKKDPGQQAMEDAQLQPPPPPSNLDDWTWEDMMGDLN